MIIPCISKIQGHDNVYLILKDVSQQKHIKKIIGKYF